MCYGVNYACFLFGDNLVDFLFQMIGSQPIEIIAAICGFVNVILIIRRSIWNYPFGFVMVTLYAKVFYDYQLYSDSILQIYFFFIQIYGVVCWLQGKADDGRINVAPLSSKVFYKYLCFSGVIWLLWSYVMNIWTDASYPYWDSAIAILSMLAQFLLSRRHIQNWYLWICVDLLAISLFSIKGLMPTAFLYFIFLILAIVGLLSWRKNFVNQSDASKRATA